LIHQTESFGSCFAVVLRIKSTSFQKV